MSFLLDTLGKHFLLSHGPIFGPLLLAVELALLVISVRLAFRLRPGRGVPRAFVQAAHAAAAERGVNGLIEVSRGERSLLGRALHAGAGRLGSGLDEARRAAAGVIEGARVSNQRLLRDVAMVAVVSPLLGLVGTLLGTILFLMELGRGASPAAGVLAEGLSHSLVVLLHGAAISVVAVVLYTVFKNRLERVIFLAGAVADDLLIRLRRTGG